MVLYQRFLLLVSFIFVFCTHNALAQCGSLAITNVTATPVSCNGGSNGSITVQTTGGTGPFTFSNGAGSTGGSLLSKQEFNSNVISSSGTSSSNFYSPPYCQSTGPRFNYQATGGCTGGSANYTGPSYGFAGCLLATPQRDASGLTAVTFKFDISHSYNSGRPLDKITFSIWIGNGYKSTSIVPVTVNGTATNELAFTQSRSCESVEVVFNLSNASLTDKSDMFLYINSSCGYNSCSSYWVSVDNIEILQGGVATYQSSGTFNNLPAGNYTITVKDANGCTLTYGSNPVVVSQPTALTATTAFTRPTTVGGTDGKAWVTASGGTPAYSYTWSSGTPAGSGDTIRNIGAGNYFVTVTDGNGCTATATANVTNPTCTLAITSLGQVNASCSGLSNGSFTIATSGANGAVQYSINGGTTWQAGNSFTNLAAGYYTVQVRDAAGCTASANGNPQIISAAQVMSLNFATTPVSTIGGNDGAINLTVTGGTAPRTYAWNNGASTEDITGLAAGQYCVTVTDNNGCTITGCGNVTAPTCSLAVSSVAAVSPTCNNGTNGSITVTSTGANGAVEYSINGGNTWQASGSFTGLAAGSYTVQAKNAAGCTANGPANPYILANPATIGLSFNTTNVTTVGGNDGAINLTVANASQPVTYLWSNNATTEDLTGLAAGQYCVTVSANGCTATACTTITQPGCTLAITNVAKNDAACFGGNGSISITATGGIGNVEYSVNGGGTWSASGTFNNLAPGSYTVQVKDGNGCSVTANGNPFVVAQPQALALTTTVTNASQSGANDGAIDLNVSGGTGAYTYTWSPNGQTTQDLANLSAGQYCVTVTDANNCTATTCATVTSQGGGNCSGFGISNLNVIQPNCPGDNGTITVSITGGSNPVLYSIDSGSTFQNGVSMFTVGNGRYNILVRDNNGCEVVYGSNPVVITSPQGITPVITANGSVLTVNNVGTSYQWLYGGNEIMGAESDSYTAIANGTYSVEVTDANGCVYESNMINITGVGVGEIADLQWTVWPNPTFDVVRYDLGKTETGRLELWAADGRLVWSETLAQAEGSINIASLASGVYTVRLVTTQGHGTKRIVKY